jgi:hypothetical protein
MKDEKIKNQYIRPSLAFGGTFANFANFAPLRETLIAIPSFSQRRKVRKVRKGSFPD